MIRPLENTSVFWTLFLWAKTGIGLFSVSTSHALCSLHGNEFLPVCRQLSRLWCNSAGQLGRQKQTNAICSYLPQIVITGTLEAILRPCLVVLKTNSVIFRINQVLVMTNVVKLRTVSFISKTNIGMF